MAIRTVVADDHPIFRDGLVRSLEETGDFRVVGIGGSADEAGGLFDQEHPRPALLGLSEPGGGGSALGRIREAGSAGQIAMLTVSEDDADVSQALQSGAIGYVLKGVSAAELRQILKGVAAGEAHVSPGLAARVLAMMHRPRTPEPASALEDLTAREEEILRLVATGMSNKEVARELDLQEKTVKHYMTAILGKLQAKNRVEAAIIAHEAWRGKG